jgi:hypothetical protein
LTALRALLGKDLRILRRSPVLVALLIAYPVAIAVLIGLALSSSPARPRVAFLNEIPPSQATIQLGSQQIDTTRYEDELFQAIQPVPVRSVAQAIADVRDGSTIAALIIPPQLPEELASAAETAYVQVIYNGNAINQALVQSAIESKLAQANALLATQLSHVADSYIDLLLSGGDLHFLGSTFDVLGLVRARTALAAIETALPRSSPLRQRVATVETFAQIAVSHFGGSKKVIGAVAAPIAVRQRVVSGARTPLNDYAVAVAVAVSLMFVCILLASGMLALEREENTLARLRRGLVSAGLLLSEKGLLAAVLGVAVSFAMLCGIAARDGGWRTRLRRTRRRDRRARPRGSRRIAAGAARLAAARVPRARPQRIRLDRPLRRHPRDLGGLSLQGRARGARRRHQPVTAKPGYSPRAPRGPDRRLRRPVAYRTASLAREIERVGARFRPRYHHQRWPFPIRGCAGCAERWPCADSSARPTSVRAIS